VRLAFSIATSVDPEVLIIDEALSVGDQHFQKKSIDRMMQFKDKGKTIFFCSHALYFVQELCNRSLWLRNGKIEEIGETSKVINAYSDWVREKDAGMNVAAGGIETRHEREVESPLWIDWVKVTDAQGHEAEVIKSGQDIHVRLRMRTKDPSVRRQGHIGISITRNDEETVYGFTTKMDGLPPLWLYEGQEVCARFPSFPLLAGQYYFLLVLADEHALHPYDIYRTEMFSVENLHGDLGMTRLNHSWDLGS
jgi:ABC-type molybdate transport system ATPase subunit